MFYSGNRKLGIVPMGTPDMNPLYSGKAAIDSTSGTFISESISPSSLISIANNAQQTQIDWPKPCEYFNSTITPLN